jgi:hypothetical protein
MANTTRGAARQFSTSQLPLAVTLLPFDGALIGDQTVTIEKLEMRETGSR